ncbi:ATP-binding cassette domain-containing protein [Nocardia halotolerans]|uniref:ATP-binding cassette domain-containing protein n=1 Tax=Nocardia halotolerans TaxID=1755878 RepID=A0ABV8VBF2_9NOCA
MITTRNLTRTFHGPGGTEVRAVDGIDLTVAREEVVAVLGPNGAGKTTLMRMLTTLLPPTSGSAEIGGHDVGRRPAQVRRVIGYVGQGNSAGHTQRAMDEVVTQARIHGLDRKAARVRAGELFTALGLEGLGPRRSQAMSGGQRRRLDLAMGLVHQPSLLFLDEPTTGLDPHNRANLWDHIARLREQSGMTIVLTTHYLDEADHMADRVVIVDHGRVIADGSPHTLKSEHAGDQVTLETRDATGAGELAEVVGRAEDVHRVTHTGTTVVAHLTNGPKAVPALITAARAHDIEVISVATREPTLDDVFLELTGRSLRDAGIAATGNHDPEELR